MKRGEKVLDKLPLGIAAPIREAARTCQLHPPTAWPFQTYMAIGRNDLASSANETVEQFNRDGFKSRKDFLVGVTSLILFKFFFLDMIVNIFGRILANVGKLSVISFQLQEQPKVARQMLSPVLN